MSAAATLPSAERRSAGARKRAVVVSHACVVPVNQSAFDLLGTRGWSIDLVAPRRWAHEYSDRPVSSEALPSLHARFCPQRVALPGQPQRHFYEPAAVARLLRRSAPTVAFLEEESFSVPAFQWGLACWRRGIPFGVQAAENLDRRLPAPARLLRTWTLRHAAFVAARSPRAKELAQQWGARGRVEVIPHAVPLWADVPPRRAGSAFTIGFAGRLVPEKGLRDLIAAVRTLEAPVRLLFAGNGPLRDEIAAAAGKGVDARIVSDIAHEDMARAYAEMDVLVLPSRSTPTWTEQFGRVLVEALWCGVPVIGSSCGEIPWVIQTTGGGRVFPEGDVPALAGALAELRSDSELRRQLASRGRGAVERMFGLEAVGALLDRVLSDVASAAAAEASRVPVRFH